MQSLATSLCEFLLDPFKSFKALFCIGVVRVQAEGLHHATGISASKRERMA